MTETNQCERPNDLANNARGALERVCSGKGLDPVSRYYSPKYCDHVNDVEFLGYEGAQRSVAMYKSVLTDIAIKVEEQLIDGNRVASRFVVTGINHGRQVRFNGITISRFEDGMIVEDWSVTDTLGMLRQLGLWRTFATLSRSWRHLAAASAGSRKPTGRRS